MPAIFKLGAQRRLRKADGNHAVQVVAVALEEVVRPDGEHHVEVAPGPAGAARVALARSSGCACPLPRPRGTFTLSLNSLLTRVSPRQVWQGSPITWPVPPHAPQVRATEKKPC